MLSWDESSGDQTDHTIGTWPTNICTGWWLTYPSEKYESRLGLLFPTYGKIENVPNHQPDWLKTNWNLPNKTWKDITETANRFWIAKWKLETESLHVHGESSSKPYFFKRGYNCCILLHHIAVHSTERSKQFNVSSWFVCPPLPKTIAIPSLMLVAKKLLPRKKNRTQGFQLAKIEIKLYKTFFWLMNLWYL
jgi:hypothetical protein